MRSLILSFMLLFTLPVFASPMQTFVFEDDEQEEVFKRLSHEIRCLVCQNQSIGDSNAELATDLREEIYNMLKDGQTEQQIVDFLVERYGDFVLYNPPMKPTTYLLWFGPFAIFLVALYFAVSFIRSHREKRGEDIVIESDDQERLERLRAEAGSDSQQSNEDRQ